MIRSIKHLRGGVAEWAENDIVVPDGELALLRTDHGRFKVRVGDGSHAFSILPSIGGDVDTDSAESITLSHGVSYRRGELYSLTLTLPAAHDDDFNAEISFDSGNNATEFSIIGGSIRFTGDGTADGEFMPEVNTHYNVFIWYDGQMQGVVRGIPNA